jgi:uncharacterized protein
VSPMEFELTGSLCVALVAVLVHHYVVSVKRLQQELGDRDAEYSALAHRGMGFVLFGLLPFLLSHPLDVSGGGPRGLGVSNLSGGLIAAVGVGALSFMVVGQSANSEEIHATYPEIRLQQWRPFTHWSSSISWAVYLLGYEYMYRGFLLFLFMDAMGPVLAVAFTTALYVLHHLPKVSEEAFGSILMGVILGVLAIWSGGFWAAFVLHALVAIGGEYQMLKSHPVIRA